MGPLVAVAMERAVGEVEVEPAHVLELVVFERDRQAVLEKGQGLLGAVPSRRELRPEHEPACQ